MASSQNDCNIAKLLLCKMFKRQECQGVSVSGALVSESSDRSLTPGFSTVQKAFSELLMTVWCVYLIRT